MTKLWIRQNTLRRESAKMQCQLSSENYHGPNAPGMPKLAHTELDLITIMWEDRNHEPEHLVWSHEVVLASCAAGWKNIFGFFATWSWQSHSSKPSTSELMEQCGTIPVRLMTSVTLAKQHEIVDCAL
eukprot:1684862-Amphidinium_carterae.2